MSDYDAYKHFRPKNNAKEDFKKSIDWIAQQEKKLNDQQRVRYEKLEKRQAEELEKLKKEHSQKEHKRKRYQPKPRLMPDSQKIKTNKKKIEVVRLGKPLGEISGLKHTHKEQIVDFLKTVETERHQEDKTGTVLDRAMVRAFEPVVREGEDRGIDKGKDRSDGR